MLHLRFVRELLRPAAFGVEHVDLVELVPVVVGEDEQASVDRIDGDAANRVVGERRQLTRPATLDADAPEVELTGDVAGEENVLAVGREGQRRREAADGEELLEERLLACFRDGHDMDTTVSAVEYSLPWAWYSDPEVLRREGERIFARSWQYVGHDRAGRGARLLRRGNRRTDSCRSYTRARQRPPCVPQRLPPPRPRRRQRSRTARDAAVPVPRVDVRPRRRLARRAALRPRTGVRRRGARAGSDRRRHVGTVRLREPGRRGRTARRCARRGAAPAGRDRRRRRDSSSASARSSTSTRTGRSRARTSSSATTAPSRIPASAPPSTSRRTRTGCRRKA